MNTRILTSTIAGLTLFALAVPSVALAKSATVGGFDTSSVQPQITVVAQDSGAEKPKAEGWQTGEGDMSDSDCQAHADRTQEYRDQADINMEAGDWSQALFDLDMADMYENAALDGGCAITHPD